MAARRRRFSRGSLVRQEEVASLGSLVGRGSGADGERQQWSGSLGGARRGNNTTDNGSSVRRHGAFSVEQREKGRGKWGRRGAGATRRAREEEGKGDGVGVGVRLGRTMRRRRTWGDLATSKARGQRRWWQVGRETGSGVARM
jgi:hypothetical protein